jgi:hypothetical protein
MEIGELRGGHEDDESLKSDPSPPFISLLTHALQQRRGDPQIKRGKWYLRRNSRLKDNE